MLRKIIYITTVCFLVFAVEAAKKKNGVETTEEILEPVFRLPVLQKRSPEIDEATIIDEDPAETLLRTYRYDKSDEIPSSVRSELLQAVQKYPEYLSNVLDLLPKGEKIHDIVKKLYDSHSTGMPEEDRENIEKWFMLNPEDGSLEKITGNFKPLKQTTYRFLQKVEGENRYWAAIPQYDTQFSKRQTVIGVYDTENFVFSPYLELPGIVFDSMDMWVDNANKTIYVVYNGHLLKFSL